MLFALHLVTIAPESNLPGQIWYTSLLRGDHRYRTVDLGVLAGAIENAFLSGPLSVAAGVCLWLRHSRGIPAELMTGAMIFSAIVGFFPGGIFAHLPGVTNDMSSWVSYQVAIVRAILREHRRATSPFHRA